MGLITKEVEVTLGVRNIKYYEKLGYKIPKYENRNHKLVVRKGTKIQVKIEDLSIGSNVEVEYECDMCHKLFTTRYDVYSTHNKDGKTLCPYCAEAPHVMKGCKKKNSNKKEKKVKPNKKNRFRKYKNKCYNRPNTYEYSIFVKKVLSRDNYECQCCHSSSNLEVHHLDGYNWCKEKRTDETNGITLCANCHANFHSKYGRGDNTKKQFEEWIGKAVGELEKYQGVLPKTRKIYCIEEDKIYDSTIHVMEEWGLKGYADIYKLCSHYPNVKSVRGKHLLWLDEYESMSDKDIELYIEKCNEKTKKGRKKKYTGKSDTIAC